MKLSKKQVISHLKRSIAVLKWQNKMWIEKEGKEELPNFAKQSLKRLAIREVCLEALLKESEKCNEAK